jgi:localization factor PodJL
VVDAYAATSKGDAIRMSVGAPWSVKGIDPKAREVAKDLARRSGMTLGEWLNRVILEDDLPEELTAEAQFTDRLHRASHGAPRLTVVPTSPDLARVAFALDRVTDRIEASETRTGLAINGVEHSVRQALARIEAAEREQHAAAHRLEARLADYAGWSPIPVGRARLKPCDSWNLVSPRLIPTR